MKKSLVICLLTSLALQAEETPVIEVPVIAIPEEAPVVEEPQPEPVNSREIITQLKQAHQDLKTLKAEMVAVLTIMLEELQDFDTTRSIDFNAWNNLHSEFEQEKYIEESEDAEEAEGEQE